MNPPLCGFRGTYRMTFVCEPVRSQSIHGVTSSVACLAWIAKTGKAVASSRNYYLTQPTKKKEQTMAVADLFRPQEDVNYDFVAGGYGIFIAIGLILYVVSSYSDSVEGFWVIFCPFVPCFLLSLPVRAEWRRQNADSINAKKSK